MYTYTMCDQNGNILSNYVLPDNVENVGQALAHKKRKTIYAYRSDDHETPGYIHAPLVFEPEE